MEPVLDGLSEISTNHQRAVESCLMNSCLTGFLQRRSISTVTIWKLCKKHRRERWLSERTVELFVSDRNGFLELFLILCRLSFYHVLLHYRHLLVITAVQVHCRPSVLRRLQRKAQHTSVYKVYNQVYFHLHGLYTYSDPLHMNTIS